MQDLGSLSADALLALSHQLEAGERYGDLEQALRRLASLQPGVRGHAVRLGWSLLALNRPAEARDVFAGLNDGEAGDEAAVACGAGIAAYRTGDLKAAVRLLAIAAEAGMAAANMPLVTAANETGLFDKALEVTRRLAGQSPLDRDTVVLHARQLALVKDFRAAADAILRLLAHKTADWETLALLSQTLAAAGDYAGAGNALGQLLRIDLEHAEMQALWTHCLAEGYSKGEAIAVLTRLTAADPQHSAAFFQLALLHERGGDLEEAARMADKAAAIKPESPLVNGLRSRFLLLRGDVDGAASLQVAVWGKMAAMVEAREKPRLGLSPSPESPEPLTPTLYIPVEISSRELASRLLIALFAARAGFTVVMMGHTVLRQADALPRGFILNKSLHVMDDIVVAMARRRGHALCVIDEEAFGWTCGANSLMRTLDPGLLPACAALFAPGRYYVEAIGAAAPEARLVNTGNPRTDFFDGRLMPLIAAEADRVREAQGRSILVCTNFGGWNSRAHHFATMCLVSLRAPGIRMNSDRGRWLRDIYEDSAVAECYDTAAIRSAVPALANAYPQHKIILRPHPVENADTWERAMAGIDNVVVSGAESFHVQMFASDAVIHVPGCGTGLEARLAGRPTVALHPVKTFAYPTLGISNQLSPAAHDIPELLRLVKVAIEAGRPSPLTAAQEDVVAAHVERPPELATAKIANHLVKLFMEASGIRPDDPGAIRPAAAELRDVVTAAKAKADAQAFGNIGLKSKRFAVGKDQIEHHMRALASRLGIAERFIVDMLADGVVMISRES